jgi:hypothetical protein
MSEIASDDRSTATAPSSYLDGSLVLTPPEPPFKIQRQLTTLGTQWICHRCWLSRALLQVLQWVLSYDGQNPPDPLAITAASAALLVSGGACSYQTG